jgi:hypothetical protein
MSEDFTLIPGTKNIFHSISGDKVHLKYRNRKWMTAETILKTSHVKHLVSLPDHKQAQGIDKVIECMNDYSHRHAEVRQLVLAVERGDVVL